MAIPLVNDDLIRLIVACQAEDQVGLNVFHYVIANVMGTPDLELMPSSIDAGIVALYQAFLGNPANFYGVSMERINPNPTQPITTGNLRPGSAGAQLAPRQSAGIITKKSALAGRSGRGRVYLPFVGIENISDNGHLAAAGLTAAANIGNYLLAPIPFTAGGNTCDLIPVIKHATGFTSVDVTTFAVRLRIGTQRRRGDYGRPNALPW